MTLETPNLEAQTLKPAWITAHRGGQALQRFEVLFTIAALLFYSSGPLTVILTGGISQGDERGITDFDFPIMRQLFALSYLSIAGLLSFHWKRALLVLSRGFCIIPLLTLVVVSVFWSDFPSVTQTRAIALLATSLFGLYFVTRYDRKSQLQILGWTFVAIVGLSFAYAVLLPKYGIMGGVHAGDWRGIYTHKNTLGKIVAFGVNILVLNVFSRSTPPLHRSFFCVGLAGAIALVLLSGSTGAIINVITLLVVLVLCQLLRLHYKLIISGLSALGALVILSLFALYQYFETIVMALGKDITLTGRTEIWQEVLLKIQERPLLGYGYHGFWQKWKGESSDILYAQGWAVPHAHNGFLDLTLNLGLLGLTLFVLGFALVFVRSLYIFNQRRDLESLWPVLLLVYLILANLVENTILRRNDLFWVLYSAACFLAFLPIDLPQSRLRLSSPREDHPSVRWVQLKPW